MSKKNGSNTEAVETTKPEEEIKVEKVNDLTFTYVGHGEGSPYQIKFMNQIECTLGKPFTVDGTKGSIIKKLQNNKCFVEGVADLEVVEQIKAEGAAKAEQQRKLDAVFDKSIKAKFRGKGRG